MYYLETKNTNPYFNLAFEEVVLTNRRDGDYLMLWQNDNTIVVGQNQNTYSEVNQDFVKEKNINVIRRNTGGGAVYHDLGNLNYSFITDFGDPEKATMERFTKPVVEALKNLGLDAEASGRNDILVSGRKISGTAQRVTKGRILHHGTLLFKSNPDIISKALNVDPEKFRSKSTKSVRSRVGNISDFLDNGFTLQEFWDYLKRALSKDGAVETVLTPQELSQVERLKKEKYESWDWNWGRSPAFDLKNKGYFPGGILEIHMSVNKGIIEDVAFFGDFMSQRPLDDVKGALIGSANNKESIENILSKINLSEYFGTITLEEILSII